MADLKLPFKYSHVMRLAKKGGSHKKVKIPAKLRAEVLSRDDFKCQWCGRDSSDVQLHVDHIVAKSKGGLTEKRNLRTLCRDCNLGRNNKFFTVGTQIGTREELEKSNASQERK
jgi:5-methylcytosine-specific restriction endonuclease McrA